MHGWSASRGCPRQALPQPQRLRPLPGTADLQVRLGSPHVALGRFLVKDMALEDILTAIRVVAAGDAMIAPGVTHRLIGQFAGEPPFRPQAPGTDRDHRPRTRGPQAGGPGHVQRRDRRHPVHHRRHRQDPRAHLLAKLGARDRGQLVITAYQAGLFDT